MQHLSIDIETYSSVDIGASGMYKYVQSPDFEMLLFACSVDFGPVQIVDLAQGESIPDEVLTALTNPEVQKHAYNAAFEWYCLSRHFGFTRQNQTAWLPQWRCTMLHGLYCGYPAGLAAVGKAIGLPEEAQKMRVGKSLIRYFCVPCKPTKVNGGRLRNFPHHDPDKWELFKDYCKQDVATETAVLAKLWSFPAPDFVQQQWVTDQIINSRGVAVEQELISGALVCAEEAVTEVMEEARRLTGLANPNSAAQIMPWLAEQGLELPNLQKTTVADVLDQGVTDGVIRRALELRQESSKTSTAKYTTMDACMCTDGRIRGLLQFYGAPRTGRWAGRLVQIQNLPRSYLSDYDLPRGLVRGRQTQILKLIYGSVADTLSQLIRTAFVPSSGCIFLDADFSAIEARVIAWLAGEQWVLDVFRTHGKIYEAAAANMFGMPVERIVKGNPEYGLRQRGKVATLALGYAGGVAALTNMDTAHALREEEKPGLVRMWRDSNPAIVRFWRDVEDAAIDTVRTGWPNRAGKVVLSREIDTRQQMDFMVIQLPSGRKLYYAAPYITVNRFGRDSIGYMGQDQYTRKWAPLETYGGKLAENITQAVARDCLAEVVETLEAAGFRIVFHVHDEVVVDYPINADPDSGLQQIIRIMSTPPAWAPDLPVSADGWTDYYFKKD